MEGAMRVMRLGDFYRYSHSQNIGKNRQAA